MKTAHLSPWRAFAVAATVFAWVLAIACSSSDAPRAGLADGCILNTDCTSPLVCAFRRCHNACTTTRDCPAPQRCMASDKPFHVCQLAQEKSCSYNSQCPNGQLCGVDGQCRDQCAADRDCLPGQKCVTRSCAEPEELTSTGTLATSSDAASPGAPCVYNTECPDPLICRNGGCAKECLGDRDCASGASCVASRCVSPTAPLPDASLPDASFLDATSSDSGAVGATCSLASDCPQPLICSFGRCSYQCNTPLDCPVTFCCLSHRCLSGNVCASDGGADAPSDAPGDAKACADDSACEGLYPRCAGTSRCVNGSCAAPSESLCDDHNPCTEDTCDQDASVVCRHVPIGPQDVDHDGHFAAQCGGTADDCDDNNPDVYPGHAELCDGIDNNCDGRVDEGVWSFGAPVTVSAAAPYGTSAGAPAIVRLADGTVVVVAGETPGTGSLDAWKLSSTLASSSGPVALATSTTGVTNCGGLAARSVISPAAATDGTSIAVGAFQSSATGCGCCGGQTTCGVWQTASLALTARSDLSSITSAVLSTESVCKSLQSDHTRAAVSWNAAVGVFDLAWADDHLGSTSVAHVYVGEMTPGGQFGGAKQVLPSLANEQADVVFASYPHIAVGARSILVAWKVIQASSIRYVLLDTRLATILAGPFDLSQQGDVLLTSLAYVGSTFALAAQDLGGQISRVHRINEQTGAESLPSFVFPFNPPGASDVHLAAVHGGFGATISRGSQVTFAWAPENLAGGFSSVDLPPGSSAVSGAAITQIDAKHAAVAWVDGAAKAAILTCGP